MARQTVILSDKVYNKLRQYISETYAGRQRGILGIIIEEAIKEYLERRSNKQPLNSEERR
jgi:metal-responsive CopG/Arc/MetJ family transcriptional regulator